MKLIIDFALSNQGALIITGVAGSIGRSKPGSGGGGGGTDLGIYGNKEKTDSGNLFYIKL